MQSKGQVTLFVIIGILIVASLTLVYVFRAEVLKSEWEREREKAALVPPQASLIKNHIDSCVKQTAEQAVKIIGSQAGYIELPSDIVARSAANPFSNSLTLGGGSEVPYWFYQNAAGVLKENIPTKAEMERDIANYIDEHISECISFDKFEEQGYTIIADRAISEVEIEDEAVLVALNYPVNLEIRDFEFEFLKFYEKADYPLGRLYDLALQILEAENEEKFLENKTLDTMIVYDEIPYSGVDFECSPTTWKRTEVEKAFRNVIETNIPYIKIKNTDYVLYNQAHRYYEVDADLNAEDVGVNFLYSANWPTFLDIVSHPGEELLRGEPYTLENKAAAYLASLFCLNQYQFVYDIKYPVLVSLSDGGFIFQYGMQVIIDNNQPRQNKLITDYVNEEESPICDKGVLDTKVYSLTADASGALRPVDNARISYQCITTTCDMGYTKLEGGQASLDAKFPLCVNGFVRADKEGYWSGEAQLSTTESPVVSVIMDKLYELDLDVRLITSSGDIRNLAQNEKVIFQFENLDNEYITSVFWPGTENIRLTAGNYYVTSQVLMEDTAGIDIPARTIESCAEVPRAGILGLIGSTKKECRSVTIPATELTSALIGGANFDWSISNGQLASGKSLTLYSFRDRAPTKLEDISLITENINKNAQNPLFKKPEVR